MTAEYFRDFFEAGSRMHFHIFAIKPVRKLRFLNRLPCNAMFYVVEQGVFDWNDFLVNRTANFHFYVSGCPVAFSPANERTLNTAAACANVSPSSVYLIASQS